ncbi:MAG TPA: sensor histidine kinase [Anaerolineae bacterium]|nr:sensor histidine kinase [Anaerolineae bacterium]
MSVEFRPLSVRPHTSLRAKIALGVALPIFAILVSFSLIHYWRERHLAETQIELAARQLAEMVLGSLRHAMATNDGRMLTTILADVNGLSGIRQVQIIGLDNRVEADSRGSALNAMRHTDEAGCVECHQFPAGTRPQAIRLADSGGMLRVFTPIVNEPACAGCHVEPGSHLGGLLVDVSLGDIEAHLWDDLRVDLLFSVGGSVLFTLGLYVLIHRLVVRRVMALHRPLAEFAAGAFNSRLPAALTPTDEIDALTEAFNHMADQLERHAREQEERSALRQRAIVEERERIARELHDGLAQLLGYVNTKAMAVRLMLKNRQMEAADKHLLQLEEAAQELFVDVREAILGLKITGHAPGDGAGLTTTLKEFTAQFQRLSGIPAEVHIAPAAKPLALPADTELQLLRIVQEALTNVRKHASATRATVAVQRCHGALELTVCDDGVGFEPGQSRAGSRPHFGLSSMRERAEAIGAEFSLDSNPGGGTRVTIRLQLQESRIHARTGG